MNIAVIGAGIMGYNHIRVLSESDEADVIAVADIDNAKLAKIKKIFRIPRVYTSYKELIAKENPDAFIVAVPTSLHKGIVLACLEKNRPVFVEKPIAHSVEDAQEMITAAKRHNQILMVGHIERFNPIISELKTLINNNFLGELYLVNGIRIGPYPKRMTDVGVLIDLAVHDLDIFRYLFGEITEIYTQLITNGDKPVHSRILLKINKKINASAEFSWVSPKRVRSIEVYGVAGLIKGDYQDQTLVFYENGDEKMANAVSQDYFKHLMTGGYVSEGKIIQFPIKKQEPLKLELAHFLDCIKTNKPPLISAEDAKKSVELVLKLLESGKNGKPILLT